MNRLQSLLAALLLLVAAPCRLCADAIGTWKLYPCYTGVTEIEPTGTDVFVLAGSNLYSYNISDNSLTEYTKLTGLSSNNITHIAWVQQAKRLVITYSDYSIDLLSLNNDITTIVDLKDKLMTGDKTINDIYVSGKYAYLSTGFGIIKINVSDAYIADTYNLGYSVDYCYIDGGYIHAESQAKGNIRALMTDNLQDTHNWTRSGNYTEKKKDSYIHDTRNNCYWAADQDSKLTKYEKQSDGTFVATSTGVKPDGPIKNQFWRLYKHDGKIFCAPGITSAGMNTQNNGCVQYYDLSNSSWTKLEEPSSSLLGTEYKIMNCMAFDPDDKNHFWVGGRSGLYEYKNNIAVKAYNSTNSTLYPMYNTDKTCALVCSMTYDNEHNLWIGNGWCDVALHCYTNKGEWKSFPQNDFSFSKLNTIDEQSLFYSDVTQSIQWVHCYVSTPVLFRASDNGNTIVSTSSFVWDDGSSADISYMYSITEDKSGNLWFATSSGPVYMSKDQRLANDNTLVRHKVPRNDGTNYADYLLDGISVRCIKIDATGRKWIGTEHNGVYLISADNNTQIFHFLTDDSPLVSNVIYDILIDDETGVVYFATDKGICSFTADVTRDNASDEMQDGHVWAYPNPVTPDHTGMITIVGLTSGSQIKILSSSGHLVHEGTCIGGAYQWNGHDYDGNAVASGVYMVNVATSEGNKGIVTKIGIVR